jgi:hypothetical protein
MDVRLFDVGPDPYPASKALEKPKSGLTCLTCEHRQRWLLGKRIVQYCGVRSSNRTANGLLKIRCKFDACGLYGPRT